MCYIEYTYTSARIPMTGSQILFSSDEYIVALLAGVAWNSGCGFHTEASRKLKNPSKKAVKTTIPLRRRRIRQ